MPRPATSRSAALVVLARSQLTKMGIVDDTYAHQMLPATMRRVATVLQLPGVRRLRRNPSFAYLGGRTRFYDRFVVDALEHGVRQVVVVAAG